MSAPAASVAPLSSAAAAAGQSDAAAASPAEAASASSSNAAATAPSSSSSAAAAPAVSSGAGHQLETRTVGLSGDQVLYLELMAERYKLKTLDKAARCLVNYADKDGDHR